MLLLQQRWVAEHNIIDFTGQEMFYGYDKMNQLNGSLCLYSDSKKDAITT
jgi:hypothetical protein